MKWWIDHRDFAFLALYGLLATAAFIAGLAFIVIGRRETSRAIQTIQQADSLMRDWVHRGCAPRTQTLP